MAYIILTANNEEIDRHELTDRPLVIGRAPDCDISVRDILMSRRHARIEPSGEDWCLIDLESKNGTFFNHEKITRKKLNDGDTVRVGRTKLIFSAGAYVPADVRKPTKVVRPSDPHEALQGTVSGFVFVAPASRPPTDDDSINHPADAAHADDMENRAETGQDPDKIHQNPAHTRNEKGQRADTKKRSDSDLSPAIPSPLPPVSPELESLALAAAERGRAGSTESEAGRLNRLGRPMPRPLVRTDEGLFSSPNQRMNEADLALQVTPQMLNAIEPPASAESPSPLRILIACLLATLLGFAAGAIAAMLQNGS